MSTKKKPIRAQSAKRPLLSTASTSNRQSPRTFTARGTRSASQSQAPSSHLPDDPALALAIVTRPLLELFAAVDDVFSEHDAFAPGNLYKGMGRIYRAWKLARTQIDPDFNPHRWTHEEGERRESRKR